MAKDTELREIKGDLETLESGYNSLKEAMARSSTELAELKHVNARLQVRRCLFARSSHALSDHAR